MNVAEFLNYDQKAYSEHVTRWIDAAKVEVATTGEPLTLESRDAAGRLVAELVLEPKP